MVTRPRKKIWTFHEIFEEKKIREIAHHFNEISASAREDRELCHPQEKLRTKLIHHRSIIIIIYLLNCLYCFLAI